MKLLGLHSKAWKMWKHEDSLFAGHLLEKKTKTKNLHIDKERELNFKA